MKTVANFEVQGHRGALGLMAENTLAGFEVALDVGVDSIETDVHLTKDGVPVLFHDERITERLCPEQTGANGPLVRSLTLAEMRQFTIRARSERATNVAERFAREQGIPCFGIPTLTEFFDFVAAYANAREKTDEQRARARRLWFDLELKRVPFRPETIGDGFTGSAPALLEIEVMAAIRKADAIERTRVRSFDHRSVAAMRELEPKLSTGLLFHHTAPVHIKILLDAMQANFFCPDYYFVDADIVRRVHEAGRRILPYTVNEPEDWRCLVDWGVDGVTTDYPDRLNAWLGR
jgi:glycerophosphoryl diester phosphodiesterase